MEKVLIRNNFVKCSSSSFYSLCGDNIYNNLNELLCVYDMNEIIRQVYDEDNKDYQQLYKSFLNAKNTGNKDFILCYKIKDRFAIKIDEHITLYKLERTIMVGNDKLIPWQYASGELFVGDTWWSSDEEVVHDITNMSFLDFITEYKCFF